MMVKFIDAHPYDMCLQHWFMNAVRDYTDVHALKSNNYCNDKSVLKTHVVGVGINKFYHHSKKKNNN